MLSTLYSPVFSSDGSAATNGWHHQEGPIFLDALISLGIDQDSGGLVYRFRMPSAYVPHGRTELSDARAGRSQVQEFTFVDSTWCSSMVQRPHGAFGNWCSLSRRRNDGDEDPSACSLVFRRWYPYPEWTRRKRSRRASNRSFSGTACSRTVFIRLNQSGVRL